MITIQESSMSFGPFKDGDVFDIEKSNIYLKLQQGMKMAEFLVIRRDDLVYIIEAKSSAPNPNNSKEKFEEFIQEIAQKLMNALTLSVSVMLGRHENAKTELPHKLENCLLNNSNVSLILVLKEHPIEALVPVHDALIQSLSVQAKIWRFEVAVINEEEARTCGLVQ